MRKFGIEIECYLPSIDALKQELTLADIIFKHAPYEEKHKVYQCVKLIKDITLKPVEGFESIEINLPPSNDFVLLEKICDVLHKINANANLGRCALHIHIDLTGVGYKNAKKIMQFYRDNEQQILNKIHQIQGGRISTLTKKLNDFKSITTKIRNTTLSLDVSYIRYRTIEHRAFCGTIDFEEIKKCVLLTQDIVEKGLKE